MSISNLKTVWQAAIAAAAIVLSAPGWAAAAEGTAPPADVGAALWTPKELTFVFQGFTSRYSCDGLLAKMRHVLVMLGARDDLKVGPYGCASPAGAPDPFPGVRIKMNVLTPAPTGGAAAGDSAASVPAQWKRIEVRLDRDPVWEAGDCELLEQIQQKILPQFTTRNVEYRSNCVPHQLSPGGTWLRAEVLIADQKGDKALASK
jgi:hypothetical protein